MKRGLIVLFLFVFFISSSSAIDFTLIKPAEGSYHSRTFSWEISEALPLEVTKNELYGDGLVRYISLKPAILNKGEFSVYNFEEGQPHTFQVKFYSGSQAEGYTLVGSTNIINFNVDKSKPSILLNLNEGSVSGSVPITATASDAFSGVRKIDFFRDGGVLLGTDTTFPYSINLNTANLRDGYYSIYAKATDNVNIPAISDAVEILANNGNSPRRNWSYGFTEEARDVFIEEATGNKFVTGKLMRPVNLGGQAFNIEDGNADLFGNQYPDMFISKYTGEGSHVWSKKYGNPAASHGEKITMDKEGFIYASGRGAFGGAVGIEPIDFGCGPLSNEYHGDSIAFVKMTTEGDCVWSKYFPAGISGSTRISGLEVDFENDIILGGYYTSSQGTLIIEGNEMPDHVTNKNGFLVKFNSEGQYLWSKAIYSTFCINCEQHQIFTDFTTDNENSIIAVGTYSQSSDLGGIILNSDSGTVGLFIAKYSSDGDLIWAKKANEGLNGVSNSIERVAVDSDGRIYVSGYFAGSIQFGNSVLQSLGNNDIFIASFDSNGNPLWARSFGSTAGSDKESEIKLDGVENLAVVARFLKTVNVGPVNYPADDNLIYITLNRENGELISSELLTNKLIPSDLELNGAGRPVVTGKIFLQPILGSDQQTLSGAVFDTWAACNNELDSDCNGVIDCHELNNYVESYKIGDADILELGNAFISYMQTKVCA